MVWGGAQSALSSMKDALTEQGNQAFFALGPFVTNKYWKMVEPTNRQMRPARCDTQLCASTIESRR